MQTRESINYTALLGAYENSLFEKTRGFNVGLSVFDSWVPDEDIVKSVVNLMEAGELGGLEAVELTLGLDIVNDNDLSRLESLLQAMGDISITPTQDGKGVVAGLEYRERNDVECDEIVAARETQELILDGSKVLWHKERIEAWQRGERIAPVTIDMALTRACNYGCSFCYATLQENDRKKITQEVIYRFLQDCADMDVKAISLISDGESTLSPVFVDTIVRGKELGIDMAVATNGYIFHKRKLDEILPHLTYLRVNITGGEPDRYAEIMGTKEKNFHQVVENIREMVKIKRQLGLDVTIGMQMVLMPEFADQIIPLAKLGKELRPDYLVIKHCSDDEDGQLGVDYSKYAELEDLLREAESYSDDEYKVVIKWSKIRAEGKRTYQRCYGPPLILQLSGSGLVAPCGMLFNEKYSKYHIGNIVDSSFKDIVQSDRYWEVMDLLASPKFNAQTMCGSLCIQHKTNEVLDDLMEGRIELEEIIGPKPSHINFI